MLQEAQKAHNKAIAKTYEQLRNLLSGDTQSHRDCVCREMHKRDSGAAVNSQVTKGRYPQTWASFLDCLELHKLTVFSADSAKGSSSTFSKRCASPRGPLCNSISCIWKC
jgi:hypothetical protein